LALAVGLVLAAAVPPVLSADCGCWRYVRLNTGDASVPESAEETTLGEVTAPSYRVAWAAGSRGSRPLLVRWNGLGWQETPLPMPADTLLEGVAAASSEDAWTIGYGSDGTPRAAHWAGDTWQSVALPSQSPSFPRGIDARTTADAWIVGSGGTGTTQATTWHWDGRDWRQVHIPDSTETASTLVAVSARASDDVWAVGGRGAFPARQLILHWDGQGWTPYIAPDLDGDAVLSDVVALDRNDVWAVGSATGPQNSMVPASIGTVSERPLAEHWDGRAWRDVPLPGVGGRFYSVTGDGHGGIWAAGEKSDGTALFARWDGHRWELSGAPVPGTEGADARMASPASGVWGLTRIPRTDYLWAVGTYRPPGRDIPAHLAITWTNAPRPR
jgi:hypothetical protein